MKKRNTITVLFLQALLQGCILNGADTVNGSDGTYEVGPDGLPEDTGGGQAPETLPDAPAYDDIGIHIAPNGNDSPGNGTSVNPYATIGYALGMLAEEGTAGDGATLILHAGTYREAVRVRIPNVTIRSRIGERAIIEVPIDDEDQGVAVQFDPDADGGKLQRLEIIGGYYYGVMLQTKWDWGDPDDRSGATGIVIEDCVIHDTGRDCIKATPGSDDATIRRCEIYNSGMRDDSNADGIDNVNADRMLVQDCYVHDIATTGMYFKGGATGCVAERLIVRRTGAGGIYLGFDTSPEFFDLEANPGYYENINGIVRNCLVEDTVYAGIGMFAALSPQVYNNTLVDTAQDGHAPLYFGLTFQDWDEEAGRPATIYPVIRNNLVIQESSIENESYVSIRYSEEIGEMPALIGMPAMSHNWYFRTDGSDGAFVDNRPESEFDGGLTGWRTHIDGDRDGGEGNPLVDVDYRLLAGSPCVGKAIPLPLVTWDLDRKPRDGQPDIGAYER